MAGLSPVPQRSFTFSQFAHKMQVKPTTTWNLPFLCMPKKHGHPEQKDTPPSGGYLETKRWKRKVM